MNGKQGDLAIIVRSQCGNEGRIVRCLEYVGKDVSVAATNGIEVHLLGHVWRVDQAINSLEERSGRINPTYHCHDHILRPLRGDVTDDEVTATFSTSAKQPA